MIKIMIRSIMFSCWNFYTENNKVAEFDSIEKAKKVVKKLLDNGHSKSMIKIVSEHQFDIEVK